MPWPKQSLGSPLAYSPDSRASQVHDFTMHSSRGGGSVRWKRIAGRKPQKDGSKNRVTDSVQYKAREHSARKEEDEKNKGASHVVPPLHRRPRHGGAPSPVTTSCCSHHPPPSPCRARHSDETTLYMPLLLAPVLRAGCCW